MRRLVPPLLLATACGTDAPAGELPVAADTGASDACALDWSAPPTAWALPPDMPLPVAEHPDATCDADGLGAWVLRDMDGDGLVDLLVTRDCADATVGDVAWRVHRGTGAGFGAGEAWTLPESGDASADTWATTELAEPSCADGAGRSAYTLRDLDGDARPDLVELSTCAEDLDVSAWRLHRNVGDGFAPPVDWPVPGDEVDLHALRPTLACDGTVDLPAWDLLDLDGDARPELVRLAVCDGSVQVAGWTVWHNDGAGFAEAGSPWAPPPGIEADRLRHDVAECADQEPVPAWFLEDLDGDGRPDFVVPEDCLDPDVGTTRWGWHRNDGDGFDATRASWNLPGVYRARSFATAPTADEGCLGGRGAAWALLDADGAGAPDLVVMDDCLGGLLGDTHWRVHVAEADGYSVAAAALLPTGYTARAFSPPAADAPDCSRTVSRPAWAPVSLDGDGRPDLVVTAACDDPDVGVATWRAHLSGCSG